MSDLRTAAQQALEACEQRLPLAGQAAIIDELNNLRAALAQQAGPVAGKVVAWGVFANINGEWQLQHPVFAGDEQGKVNSEFERASYSGPQPLEVRPLGVVTATAQQAEPLNLRDPAVQKRLASQWGYVPAAAQAEPVQEPVYKVKVTSRWHDTEPLAPAFSLPDGEHLLYTAPPQRKPLTEGEIDGLVIQHAGYGRDNFYAVARAVERAHGIKE